MNSYLSGQVARHDHLGRRGLEPSRTCPTATARPRAATRCCSEAARQPPHDDLVNIAARGFDPHSGGVSTLPCRAHVGIYYHPHAMLPPFHILFSLVVWGGMGRHLGVIALHRHAPALQAHLGNPPPPARQHPAHSERMVRCRRDKSRSFLRRKTLRTIGTNYLFC